MLILAAAAVFNISETKKTNHTEKNLSEYVYGSCKIEVKKDKSFVDNLFSDPVAFFTAALAFLTLVLAGVGVAQVYFLRRADETARRTADAAKQNADALTASERAHIRVQQVRIDPGDLFDFAPTELETKFVTIKISWIIENHGKTPAEIDGCMVALWVGLRNKEETSIPLHDLMQQTIPGGKQSGENFYTSEIALTRHLRNQLIQNKTYIRAECLFSTTTFLEAGGVSTFAGVTTIFTKARALRWSSVTTRNEIGQALCRERGAFRRRPLPLG